MAEIPTKAEILEMLQEERNIIIKEISRLVAPQADNEWMDSSDIMKYMKWSRATLSKYRPEIPFRKLGKLLIRKNDFEDWIEYKFNME